MYRKIYVLLGVYLCQMGISHGQNDFFPLEKLSIEQGLSHNWVGSILKDRKGFMWFGTRNGLNRFDGVRFEHIPIIPNSSSYSAIFHFVEDPKGWFWVLTNDGLIRFHPYTRAFKRIKLLNSWSNFDFNQQKMNIELSKKGYAWVATQDYLYKIDLITHQFKAYPMPFKASRLFFKTKEDSKGRVWVQISTALYRFNEQTQKFTFYEGIDDLHNNPNFNFINIPYEDSAGQIWLPIWYAPLKLYDEQQDRFVGKGEKQLASICLQEDISADGKRFLWMSGGPTGLQTFWIDDHTYTPIESDPCKPYAHNKGTVLCFYKDPETAVVWLGTDKGVEKHDTNAIRFKRAPLFKEEIDILGDISGVVEHSKKKKVVWMATWPNGLFMWDRNNNQVKHYQQKNTPMPDPALFDITQDQEGTLWLAAAGGFYAFMPEQNQWEIYNTFFNRDDVVSNVLTIHQDTQRALIWIGCNYEGVWYLDKQTKKIKQWKFENVPLMQRHYINDIVQDYKGNIWIASNLGLYFISADLRKSKKIFNEKLKASPVSVQSIHITKQNKVWITCPSFMLEMDLNGKILQSFDAKKSFNSNLYYMAEDELGYLWIGSDNGLHLLEPNTRRLRTFHKDDGLISNDILNRISVLSNGEIFIGFEGNFNFFHPQFLKYNQKPAQVAFTNIKINNKTRIIDFEKELTLHPNEISFYIDFTALNYSLPHKNKFAYMLEGFDKDWVITQERAAHYTNLNPGFYTFKVKAANNDYIWNDNYRELKISVLAPFYSQTWFKVLLIMAVFILLLIIYQYQNYQRKKIDNIRNRIAKDLHDDMGSTLSSIRIISDVLQQTLENPQPESKIMLQRISQGAASLSDAMQDIIWSIKTDYDTLEDMIARMRAFALKLLEAKNIHLHSQIGEGFESRHLSIEQRRNIYLIFKEAINNIVKYADCSEVRFSLQMERKKIMMCIEDNGKGFDKENITLGNGLHNMEKRAQELKGKCLINSTLGKGTTVILYLAI